MLAVFPILALCAATDAVPRCTVQDAKLTGPAQVIFIRGNGTESVLDVVGKLPQAGLTRKDMWIVRRTGQGKRLMLNIDWKAITQQGVTATNYQLFDGDRLYLQARPTR